MVHEGGEAADFVERFAAHGQSGTEAIMQAAFDHFIDVSDRSDADVAALMRDERIDIAIDLAGYTRGHRTSIFARRAAPVQVNFLGFPATMGAPYIDYLIADRFAVPADRLSRYAERIVWLPQNFQPNDARRNLPTAGPPRSRVSG